MKTVLEKIPLDAPTKAVWLGQPSVFGRLFQLLLAHESGEWGAAAALEGLRLDTDDVAACYWQAQHWAANFPWKCENGSESIMWHLPCMTCCAKQDGKGLAHMVADEYHKNVLI